MNKRFDTGKQPYDVAKDTRATALSHKPMDFVRLSSESTREIPRLLGGTPDAARKYLDNLNSQQYGEYKKFLKAKSSYGTEIAKNAHSEGYNIYLEYSRKYEKGRKEGSSLNQSMEYLNNAVIEDYTGYKEELARQAKEWQAHLAETSKKR